MGRQARRSRNGRDIARRIENAFIDVSGGAPPLEENDCSGTAGTMIIPLDRGDWQGIKRESPDSAAFSLCLHARHYARVDRVEINGNDDN